MCGIVGMFSLAEHRGIDDVSLRSAMQALRHRGPDGEAWWLASDRRAGLAHTRLAIIGLTNGIQPITNETGDIHIVVNGEFYDFERIRADLLSRGHRFKTDSDSEIALHLYEDFGTDCLQQLRGEFALIIYDDKKKQLFAARDRFGIKPLTYSIFNGNICLASEAKALFAAGAHAKWDAESFYDDLSMITLPDRTLFAGVNQVRPGHYILATETGVRTFCYWDLQYSAEQMVATESELIEVLRFRLEESVKLRLRADIPVCCHLSGGIDSSTILGLAASQSSRSLDCFTLSFDETAYDEVSIAEETASHVGAMLNIVPVSRSDILKHLPDAVYFSEGLAINGNVTAKYILHQYISRAGFKVVLSGEGADELFLGYYHLREDLYRSQGQYDLIQKLYESLPATSATLRNSGDALPLSAVEEQIGFIPAFLKAAASKGYKAHTILEQSMLKRYAARNTYKKCIDYFDIPGQLDGRERVYQSSYLWCKTYLVNYILRLMGDGTEMANAVEGRTPFLDHVLFDFVKNIPQHLKITDKTEKYILREAAQPIITDTVYRRRKSPLITPPVTWFADAKCQELLQDIVRSTRFASVPFFDHKRLVSVLDRLPYMEPQEASSWDPLFMIAISSAILQERFHLTDLCLDYSNPILPSIST